MINELNSTNIDTIPSSFDEYPIPINILRCIYSSNMEKPTIIQHSLLSTLFSSNDLCLSSQSNSGKTTGYIIYTLSKINITNQNQLQCLILSSTRDSAEIIEQQYKSLNKCSEIKMLAFLGGTSIREDIKNLKDGCQIVVGTPGRIADMINKKIIVLNDLKVFIVDEIDELINRGYETNLKKIINYLPANCQKAVFNSNISDDITKCINFNDNVKVFKYDQKDTIFINKNIRQFMINLNEDNKLDTLFKLFQQMEISQLFIYCNDKKTAENINEEMNKRNFISAIFDEKKEKIKQDFKKGFLRVLIIIENIPCTDLDNLHDALIINYNLPSSVDSYFIRISRIECFCIRNIVINFVTEKDNTLIQNIQNKMGNNFIMEELPKELSFI